MYDAILSEIHDRWFGGIAWSASRHLEKRAAHLKPYRIVDIGCGSGELLDNIQDHCSAMFGFDVSRSMIEKCRARLPNGTFEQGDVFDIVIPRCNILTMVGEVVSYATASDAFRDGTLTELLVRIFDALDPGGVLLFDVLGKDHVYSGSFFHDREEFSIFSEVTQKEEIVQRRIISFLNNEGSYRKSTEIHRQRRFDGLRLETVLAEVGFDVQRLEAYDERALLPGRLAYECGKPARC